MVFVPGFAVDGKGGLVLVGDYIELVLRESLG